MKTRFFFLAIIMMVASSCSTTKYFVASNYALETVENNINESSMKVSSQNYNDDVIDISMEFGEQSISMFIGNQTSSSIKILWDDAAYIDQFGSAHRVIHLGTKLIDRDKAQVPSVVPKGSHINEEVVPSDCIEWMASTSNWEYTPVSQMYMYNTEKEAQEATMNLADVQLLLPIEANGQRYEYTFKFVDKNTGVKSIEQTDWTNTLWATTAVSCAALVVELIVLSSM